MSERRSSTRTPERHHRRHHDRVERHKGSSRRDTRSRSPRRDHHHSHRQHRRERSITSEPPSRPVEPVTLPFGASPLSKHHLARYKPLFSMYLDIQKNLVLEDLDEKELRGRWKSFVGRCIMLTYLRNRGELAEGWYDPGTLEKALNDEPPSGEPHNTPSKQTVRGFSHQGEDRGNTRRHRNSQGSDLEEEEDDDAYGPMLPYQGPGRRTFEKAGPTQPTVQDIQLKREDERLSLENAREAQQMANKQARMSHGAELRALQDEIAPRAEPGTRERRLEKRREVAASNRAFAESRRGGSPGAAVPDEELMGGGADGGNELDSLKRAREKEARKKNDRELRREEILKARAAEREQRLKSHRQKEQETMEFLRSLAKQRFG